jgi:hypothetical protein
MFYSYFFGATRNNPMLEDIQASLNSLEVIWIPESALIVLIVTNITVCVVEAWNYSTTSMKATYYLSGSLPESGFHEYMSTKNR